MGKFSMREAVKHFHVSRPTLQKALKSGKISGVQDGKGQWKIDSSELTRVYQSRTDELVKGGKDNPVNFTSMNTPFTSEVDALKTRLAEAEKRAVVTEALAEERGKHIEDLRRMLPAPQKAQRPGRRWPWKR